MHWLQSLDLALFHYINGALANPFFDWLMPILSGNGVPWLPAVIVAVPAVFIWGSTRLKICTLLMVLVVAAGDGLIINNLKDTVQRHRPFVTLPDARLFGETGKGYVAPLPDGSLPPTANHHSFPSAHSANWFAIATVAFLFYRRSAKFLFPLAATVAISRVYNGVHYPSDVLAGAFLGAGYAIALVIATQTIWNLAGKSFFPNWHAQLPSLLNPQTTSHSPPATRHSSLDWLHLGYLVILLALAGRWIYLASGIINLSQDEAYQWLWSKHLALSYYSKPPGIALLQWFGTHLFGDTEFGVRFCSPLLAAILSVLVLRFMTREVGTKAAFTLLLITFAVPLLVVGSVLMTIDPPLVLCWMWAVVAGWRAVAATPSSPNCDEASQLRYWLIVGLALGLGFLCKYTAMLQLVCWAIFFALHRPTRRHLKKSGPWLALGVFALCTLPVLIWNSQHGWITVSHVAGDAGLLDKTRVSLSEQLIKSLNYFLEFTGAELGLLNPIFFIAALAAFFIAWRRRAEKPLWLFLLCMSAPVFLGHWLFSFHSRVQPNWIAAAVPPMLCLMVAVWSESKIRVKPWLAAGILLGLIANVFLHDTGLIGKIAGHKLPGDKDPAHRLFGWRETAQLVEAERAKFDTNAFIIADHYGTTGLYSFYSAPARAAANAHTPLVYCVDADRTLNQFPFWDEYNYRHHRQGENAIFVLRLDPYPLETGWLKKWFHGESVKVVEQPPRAAPERIAAEFESVTNLGVHEVKISDGRIFQRVQIFGCYRLK
jgi:membrane-associated phospholipid phosphatase